MKTISTKALNVLSKTFIIPAAFFCLINTAAAQVCSSPSTTIYSLANAGGIYPITVSNASVGSVVNSTSYGASSSANGIGYNANNGLFYYFQVALSGSKTFVSYNPTTNSYTTLASSSIAATMNRGCVNFNGTGYYGLDNNSNLYYYNIAANTWTLICSTFKDQFNNNVTSTFSTESSGDMTIDGLGNLWICASNGSKWGLYELAAPLPTTSVASITVQQLIAPTTSTPAGLGFVGIAFDPAGDIYMATTTDLYQLKNTSTLSHIGAFSIAGICGDLTSCSFPYSVLPVSWENFSVTPEENKSVSVSWEVSQQINNSGYYVERSADGANWDRLGFVAGKNSNGQTITYYFSDNNPVSGKSYYRICQVDMDGKESYSEVKTVNINNRNNNVVSIWPNPARDAIKIQNNCSYTIARIYSQSGSIVNESRLQSGTNTINVSSLPFGAYIVNVKDSNGGSYNQKFIKE